MQDDRVDATTRGFLGLTVACAQCHDHKFDPIPTKDFYSIQSIFSNTQLDEAPLADEATVKAWKEKKAALDKAEASLKKFYETQTEEVGEMLAARTDEYLLAARGVACGRADWMRKLSPSGRSIWPTRRRTIRS